MTLREDSYIRPCRSMTVLITLLVLGGCFTSALYACDLRQEIEHRYSSAGPLAVTPITIPAVRGQLISIAYRLTDRDGPAPLVIWQNGTGEPIATYDAAPRHLASRGEEVIGRNDWQMGLDHRAISLIENAALWSSTPDHLLYQSIRAETFALVGSSQGAVSNLNSHARFATGREAAALAIHGAPTEEAIELITFRHPQIHPGNSTRRGGDDNFWRKT